MTSTKKTGIKILAVESSCDETAASILHGNLDTIKPNFTILSSVVKSQIEMHRKTGGVVPEVAARAHLQNILPVVTQSLDQAQMQLTDIDYLAVTSGPGLVVSLVVGTEFIKSLSFATGIPLLPTNHMAGHLYSAFLGEDGKSLINKVKFPIIALVVSGGHTMLLVMKDFYNFHVIGQTVDDAVGEAFDKVARLLGLPYPGGPQISKLAQSGTSNIAFPRPMIHEKSYNFSFSGLKTAVVNHVKTLPKRLTTEQKANIAASFETAAVDVLVKKTLKAARQYQCKTIALAGGVAANQVLRNTLNENAKANKLNFVMPPIPFCMDNAAMIAIAAYFNLKGGQKPKIASKVKADPAWELL